MEFGPYRLAPREESRLGTLRLLAGSLHIEVRLEGSDASEDLEGLATIYDAATELTMINIGLAADTTTRVMLPPGRYFAGGHIEGYAPCRTAPFEIAAGAVESIRMEFRRAPPYR